MQGLVVAASLEVSEVADSLLTAYHEHSMGRRPHVFVQKLSRRNSPTFSCWSAPPGNALQNKFFEYRYSFESLDMC